MNVKIEAASITDSGLNPHKKVNEDSFLVLKEKGVYVVADGVGGADAGDVASQSVVETIKKSISNKSQYPKRLKTDSIGLIKDLINAGNIVVYNIAKKKGSQMASTIAMLIVVSDYAILGHVGDSRIYVARNGKLLQLTKDHSKLQALIDSHSITPEEVEDFQDRHVITKALGLEPKTDPDIQKVMLKNNDIFILCTDGIYNHNSNDEILENVNSNRLDLKRVCEVFKDNCYKKGAKDHLTAIVLRIEKQDDDKVDTKRFKMTQDMIDTVLKK